MIQFHCHGCSKPVSSALPDDAILRAIAWCPECLTAFKDQYVTAADARKFRWLIENSSGYDDPDNDSLIERLRNFDSTISTTTSSVERAEGDA